MKMASPELPNLAEKTGATSAAPVERLAALAGVMTQLTVVAGHASLKIGDLLNLREGHVLPLEELLNAPFDVLLGEHVIARGELVVAGDQYGLRILQVALDRGSA